MKKLVLLAFVLVLLSTAVVVSKPIHAGDGPIISLNPTELTVPEPGQNFTIDVNITDVTAPMQEYEFKLGFNNTILNATDVVLGPINPLGTMLGPVDPITYEWTPLQNVSDGFVWVIAILPFGQPFTGSEIMMTISFTALAIGNSTLDLYDIVLKYLFGIWPPDVVDGTVIVVPELPETLVMPMLVVATLAAAILAKEVWSRKHKDALTAE